MRWDEAPGRWDSVELRYLTMSSLIWRPVDQHEQHVWCRSHRSHVESHRSKTSTASSRRLASLELGLVTCVPWRGKEKAQQDEKPSFVPLGELLLRWESKVYRRSRDAQDARDARDARDAQDAWDAWDAACTGCTGCTRRTGCTGCNGMHTRPHARSHRAQPRRAHPIALNRTASAGT